MRCWAVVPQGVGVFSARGLGRRIFLSLLTAVAIPSFSLASPIGGGGRFQAIRDLVGGNVNFLHFYSQDGSLLNIFPLNTGFRYVDRSTYQSRPIPSHELSRGWPTYLPQNNNAETVIAFDAKGNYRGGRYVLTWDGTGNQISLSRDAQQVSCSGQRCLYQITPTNDGILATITALNPSSPIRQVRLVPEQYEFYSGTWHPEFVRDFAGLKTIRFLDFALVNDSILLVSGQAAAQGTTSTVYLPGSAANTDGAYVGKSLILSWYDSTRNRSYWKSVIVGGYRGSQRAADFFPPMEVAVPAGADVEVREFSVDSWSARSLPGDATISERGVPLEYQIDLANEAGADGWFHAPSTANDQYMREMARLLRGRLNANLNIYIEYSNENWNPFFPTFHFNDAQGWRCGVLGYHNVALNVVKMVKTFTSEFGVAALRSGRGTNSRIRFVYGGQNANPWISEQALTYTGSGLSSGCVNTIDSGRKMADYVDVFAVAPYFATWSGGELDRYTVEQMFGLLESEIHQRYTAGRIIDNLTLAARNGLKLGFYENGTHMVASSQTYGGGVFIDTTLRSGTATTMQLEQWVGSNQSGSYVGSYVYSEEQGSFGEYRRIIAYDGVTRTITVESPFSQALGTGSTIKVMDSRNLKIVRFSRHPAMESVVWYELARWAHLVNVLGVSNFGPHVWYKIHSPCAAAGCWGMKESFRENDTPKLRGLRTFLDQLRSF